MCVHMYWACVCMYTTFESARVCIYTVYTYTYILLIHIQTYYTYTYRFEGACVCICTERVCAYILHSRVHVCAYILYTHTHTYYTYTYRCAGACVCAYILNSRVHVFAYMLYTHIHIHSHLTFLERHTKLCSKDVCGLRFWSGISDHGAFFRSNFSQFPASSLWGTCVCCEKTESKNRIWIIVRCKGSKGQRFNMAVLFAR